MDRWGCIQLYVFWGTIWCHSAVMATENMTCWGESYLHWPFWSLSSYATLTGSLPHHHTGSRGRQVGNRKVRSHEGPYWALPRSSTSRRRCAYMCLHGRTFVSVHLWSTHCWAKPETVHSPAWCRSWVIEMRKPCSLKDSEISYSRLNGDVSECKRRQWSKNERHPQPQGPAIL